MIKVIKNILKSSKSFCNSVIKGYKIRSPYSDLLPVDSIQNDAEYIRALSWAFKNKRIKNIALTGPYGAGKSSIIESFLKSNWRVRRKALRISMASFEENNSENGTQTTNRKIPIRKEEIEHGILKQLFYKVGYSKIPQSRYRKLHKVSLLRTWFTLVLIAIVAISFTYIFFDDFFSWTKEKVVQAGDTVCLSEASSIILFSVIILILLLSVSYAYKLILSRYRVKKVTLPIDATVEEDRKTDEPVFNKYIDEILYFFEVTKYRIICFEDLDRLDDASIFIHLRELNTLLNNYDKIRSPIVFIYAVKDNIFSEKDRTKFFDFIIPVVPIINSTNSDEAFTIRLENYLEEGFSHNISESFVLDVSPFITDMRVLQNIYNEFIVYKKTIQTGQELKLSDEKMMALIVFKNLYPSDFAELQTEKGIVKKAFGDKSSFIKRECDEIQDEIDRLSELVREAENEYILSVKELKAVFLCEITGWTGSAYYIEGFSGSTIMQDDFDFNQLASMHRITISYNNYGGRKFFENYTKLLNVLLALC